MNESVSSPFLVITTERAVAHGDWTLANYVQISANGATALKAESPVMQCKLSTLDHLDTTGAALLVDLLGPNLARCLQEQKADLSAERLALLEQVSLALAREKASAAPKRPEYIPALKRAYPLAAPPHSASVPQTALTV